MTAREERGQALLILVAGLTAVLVAATVLGGVARGIGLAADRQGVADISALAAARVMHDAYPRLFLPPRVGALPNPLHLNKARYLALGEAAARAAARANGAETVRVSYPDERTFAPVRVRAEVLGRIQAGTRGGEVEVRRVAEARLAPALLGSITAATAGGGYRGPLEHRQGKPLRPDVALAFDRLDRAAAAAGVALTINSGYRSDAEQAILFARDPDPRMVARPGESLHRLGTELDLGPPAAYGWLATHAPRVGFVQRYSWEPWHWGYTHNAGTASILRSLRPGGDGRSAVPSFVPERFTGAVSRAAQRFSVSAALLSAQILAESNFNPFAVSPVGARGIAQFMPATARAYGLENPFDTTEAIAAQARLMRDLLRRFGDVSLALAAYNAGPGRVAACGCVPPIPETQGYVARILGLLGGAGDPAALGASGRLDIRLVG